MKNKGRRHKGARDQKLSGLNNCKSVISHITRPIESMSSKGMASSKFDKKKWIKRMRGYLKTEEEKQKLLNTEI